LAEFPLSAPVTGGKKKMGEKGGKGSGLLLHFRGREEEKKRKKKRGGGKEGSPISLFDSESGART